jgi:hypothetical protein
VPRPNIRDEWAAGRLDDDRAHDMRIGDAAASGRHLVGSGSSMNIGNDSPVGSPIKSQ